MSATNAFIFIASLIVGSIGLALAVWYVPDWIMYARERRSIRLGRREVCGATSTQVYRGETCARPAGHGRWHRSAQRHEFPPWWADPQVTVEEFYQRKYAWRHQPQ